MNSSGNAAWNARRRELPRHGIGKTLNDSVNAACRAFDGTPIAISWLKVTKRPDPGQEIAVSNALVPVRPVNRDTDRQYRVNRPDCGFIAHLIATKTQAPQTRTRRRAEPGEAIRVYNGLGHRPGTAGRVLSRSL